MRKCNKCGGENTTKTARMCSNCKKEYDKKYYSNTQKILDQRVRVAQRNARELARIHEFIRKFLSKHPCVDCGEKDIVVLDFDHIKDKESDICRMIRQRYSIERIQKEIDKCVIRCSNCHRRKTAKENNWYKLADIAQ